MVRKVRPHGTGVRGINLPRGSDLLEGRFGRLFRTLPPGEFTPEALEHLASKMVSDGDDPKDGIDSEESAIPAAFTYLGQFIDHDLTFDPASSLQKQNDPDALVDFRTPRFDLDCLYGRGPDDQPYFYENGKRFILGEPLTGGEPTNPNAHDLPRSRPVQPTPVEPPDPPMRAIIGDPRNDENVIVSQLQGLMMRFHNFLAAQNPNWPFERVQQEVRFHYQWVILHDFLPRIINSAVLEKVLPGLEDPNWNIVLNPPKLEFFKWKREPFMPIEFSVAAYRFGHSMVRPGYRLNDVVLLPIFDATNPNNGLNAFNRFNSAWAIDWGRFIDLDPRPEDGTTRTQLAYRIDTSLVNPLGKLPPSVAPPSPMPSLANLNLLRGLRMGLPTGQSVSCAMGMVPLKDEDIKIGKFEDTDQSKPLLEVIDPKFREMFAGKTPLWTYILAETIPTERWKVRTAEGDRRVTTFQLGPVGGRIVAEVFAGIMLGDSKSYLRQNPLWKPGLAKGGVFGLRELIAAALQG